MGGKEGEALAGRAVIECHGAMYVACYILRAHGFEEGAESQGRQTGEKKRRGRGGGNGRGQGVPGSLLA